jgi:nucleotide-binding universal stress UspA family protein
MRDLKAAADLDLSKVPGPDGVPESRVKRQSIVGRPFEEIVRYAKVHDVDLIVIGSHGRRGLSHLLLGSVAERVVRTAGCPVLTVRPDQHQFVNP